PALAGRALVLFFRGCLGLGLIDEDKTGVAPVENRKPCAQVAKTLGAMPEAPEGEEVADVGLGQPKPRNVVEEPIHCTHLVDTQL
ncbi:MAG: hypothetical protein P8J82_07040, partial [Tateyamaria sp.]|nr:hypothetical protein [Tateyamaria sp.]